MNPLEHCDRCGLPRRGHKRRHRFVSRFDSTLLTASALTSPFISPKEGKKARPPVTLVPPPAGDSSDELTRLRALEADWTVARRIGWQLSMETQTIEELVADLVRQVREARETRKLEPKGTA